ncbi:MAG TPA: hypothetical protein VIZ43_17185 [Trebonia sp.]
MTGITAGTLIGGLAIAAPPCTGAQTVIVRPNHQALLTLVCYVP